MSAYTRFIAYRSVLIAGLVMLIAAPASAAELIREFSGDRDQTTAEFEIQSPWILEWRVGSDFPQSTRFELWTVDAMSGYSISRVIKIKKTGSGTKLFTTESGRMRLRVSASYADWRLKISEITQAEADALVRVPKPWERERR